MLVPKKLFSHLHESLDILNGTILLLDLRGRVVAKGRNIKNFVKSQLLFDVHWQYL